MSSLFSFLNQKLSGNKIPQQDSTADVDNALVAQQWKDFMQLYQENEKVFTTAERVDIVWASQTDKAAELEAVIDSFASTSSIVLEGLLRLVNLHPSFGGRPPVFSS